MSKAMNNLMKDHDAILSSLTIFSKILEKLSIDNDANPEELLDFTGFLMDFVDKCHHGKEEGILFPAMIAAGVPDRGGPIGAMMADHILGRGYIHTMLEALEEPEDYLKFDKAGKAYIILLQMHIQKENSVVLPMADHVISPGQMDLIQQAFVEHEDKVLDQAQNEDFKKMFAGLRSKYSV